MAERFTGTVEAFCDVDVSDAASWIQGVAFEDWPQQRPVNGNIRPAMVTDLDWNGFGKVAYPIIRACGFEGQAYQLMLSAVMPGQQIEPHCDAQADYWLTRVHVPLITNPKAWYAVEGKKFFMKVGKAYRINTMREHAAGNDGATPRVHFMFDVR